MAADVDADIAFESTDMLDGDDLKFDDTQCISVSRSMGKFQAMPGVPTLQHCESEQTHDNGIAKELGPRLYSAPADMVSPEQDEQPEPAESSAINACKPIIASVDGHLNRPVIHKTLSDPTTAYRTVLIRDKDDDDEGKDDDDSMEAMNMPFWYLPLKRQKPHAHHAGDSVPDDDMSIISDDDMSIISDASLIPTYYPSDIMRHQQRPQHRAFIKRVIRAKAKAAKQTMRELKRSCRDAVEHVFVEPAASHKAPKCVAVGSAY
jgi:hypothetical protein